MRQKQFLLAFLAMLLCFAAPSFAQEVQNVAKIGGTEYATLQAAINADSAGQTITLLGDVTEDVTVSKAVTIDGAGKTYTGAMTLKADATFKNVNFDGKGFNGYAITTRGAQYLTIEDCTAKNYGYGFVQLASATALTTVKNVTASDMNYGVKVDYSGAVVLENVDITAGVAAVLNSNYGEKTITIKDSNLSILGTWTRNNTIKTNYVFEGANTIDQFLTEAGIDNFKLAGGATLTAPEVITVTTVENYVVKYENGTYTSVEAVAEIDEVDYATLADAVAAAESGATVKIKKDIVLDNTVVIPTGKSITLDLQGKTISQEKACTASYQMIENNGNLTITGNGKLSFKDTGAGDPSFGWGSYTIYNRGTLVVENGTIEHLGEQNPGNGQPNKHMYCAIFQYSGFTTINGGKISTPTYRSARLWKGVMTINGGEFEGQLWVQAVDNSAKLTINSGTFAPKGNDGSSVFVTNDQYDVEFAVEDGTFNGKIGCSVVEKLAGTINGGKFNAAAKEGTNSSLLAEGVGFGELKNGYYEVVAKVAEVDGVGYKTLTAALAAAKSGDTITFVADITEDVTITKSLTIDGADKTYTGSMTLKNKANVTVNNVNFDGKGYNGYAINSKGATYLTIEDCTATNYGFGFVQLSSGNAKTTVKNVTVQDMNYGVKVDYSNAVVLENVDINVGNAAVYNSNYGVKTITIKDSKLNVLRTWKRNDTTKTTYVFEGANSIDQFKIDAAIDNLMLKAGATLTAPEGINVTTAEDYVVKYENGTYTSVKAVAKIGEVGYLTFADALEAAQAGETITLLSDITPSEIITINKAITLDGKGKTLTSTAGRAINVDNADGATIKNLTINASGERAINVINNATNVTVEGVTATAANYTVNLAASAANAVVVIKASNLTGLNVVNVAAANAQVTINGGTITCNDQNDAENYAALALNKAAVNAKIVATGVTFDIKGDSVEASNGAEGGSITINGEEVGNKIVAIIEYPNTDNYYSFTTLADAFKAVKDGEVITLCEDLTIDSETYTIADGKNVTLNMNGKKITVTDNKTANYELFYIYGGLTVNGNGTIELTATNNRAWNAMSAIFHNRGGVLNVENGTFKHLGGTDMAYVIDNSGNYYGDATTNVADGELSSSYIAIRNRMEQNTHGASGKAILNVAGGEIIGVRRAIWGQAASVSTVAPATGEINVTGGNIGLIDVACSAGAKAMTTISGGTVASFKGEAGELKVINPGQITGQITIMNAAGEEVSYVVSAEGLYICATAKIGEQGYETLAEAVAAAQAGETVTLIANATGAGVVIDKDITIDFAGKTYTANEGVGSAGTQTLGLQILKDNNVTLKNGTLTSEGDKVKMLVQNYANLTVVDMNLVDATNVIQYVLSNNSGDVAIKGNTNITTDAVAFDACKYANYAIPTVTVETTGKIAGAIEVTGGNLVIKGGEFSADVTAWVADGYKATKNAEGLYVVAMDPVAEVNGKKYASLREAVDAAPAGATVTLLKNVTLKGGYADDPEAGLRIEKAITIIGKKNYTIDCGQFSKGIRIYINDSKKADVEFNNVTIKNDNPYGRCIDTRTKNIALEIKGNAKLIAHGVNSQPLTVGGSSTTYRVRVSNATIDAGATGYGIISFVRVSNNIEVSSSSKISGLAAVYLKKGADNTSVSLGNGTYTGTNKNTKESGAFGTIVIEGKNNTIDLNHEKSVVKAVSANGSDKAQQAAFLVLEGATGNKIQITNAKAKVETTGDRAHFAMIHNASNTTIVENKANVQLAAECNNYQYRTFDEAYRASENGSTVKLLADVERTTAQYVTDCDGYASIFNIEGRELTFDLNGHAINVTAYAADLVDAKGQMLMAVFSTDEGGKLTLKDSSEAKTGTVEVKAINDANVAKVYSLITNYEDGCYVTIEGGKYKADKVYDSLIYSGASDCVTINNGNYHLGNVGEGGAAQNGKPWIFNALGQNQRNIDVYGGTFNADINHQYWCYEVDVPMTRALRDNNDGTWTVVDAEAYVVEPKWDYTHEVGYPTLSEAIARALELNNTSVVMVKNATTEAITIANGKVLTLDLNGKTIAATDNTSKNYSLIDNRGDLTITGEGVMTVKATVNSGWNRYSAVIANNPGGKLVINGGTLEHLGGTDMAYGIDNLTNGKGTYAETIVNGGTIKSPYRAIRQFLNGESAKNILTINDGVIEGTNKSIFFHDPSAKANNGTLTVGEEATLKGDVYLFVTAGSTVWPVDVMIAKDALEGNVLSANVPDGYAVSEYETYWTVEALRLATLTIEDDCVSYQNVVEKQVGELTYVRQFNDTKWQTIYLPFAVKAENLMNEFEVAYIYNASYKNGVAAIDYVVVDGDYTLEANYPYLIRAKEAGEKRIVVENATLKPTAVESIDCSSVFETFTFTGNYATIGEPCDPTTCNKGHFVMNGGAWTGFNGLNPFRVYMTIELRNGEAFPTEESIIMRKVDKNGNVDTSVEKIGVDADILGIYDLQGRRVLEPQKGEIYIINGKKVVF